MQNLVFSSHCNKVIGAPSSLLKFPAGATVGATVSRMWRSKSFVVVFPCDPVSAITLRSGRAWRTCDASELRAVRTSFTTMQRSGTSLVTKARTAPCAKASETNLWPSVFSPTSARKIDPSVAWPELNAGAAVTVISPPINSPPTILAISDALSAIISNLQSLLPEPYDHQILISFHRSLARFRGPCPRSQSCRLAMPKIRRNQSRSCDLQ